MIEQQKRIIIENKAQGPVWEKQFFTEIQEAIVAGYRLAENMYSADSTMRNYLGHMGRAVLYIPGYEPLQGEPMGVARAISSLEDAPEAPVEPSEPEILVKGEDAPVVKEDAPEAPVEAPEAKEDNLDSLTKKKELLKYAKEAGIEVPQEMNVPSQIKKFIKDTKAK